METVVVAITKVLPTAMVAMLGKVQSKQVTLLKNFILEHRLPRQIC